MYSRCTVQQGGVIQHFFAIFEKLHVSADQSFHFQKIAGTLNMNIFLKFAESFLICTIKEQSPRRKFEIKNCLIFFKNSQKWSKWFLICTGQNKICFWGSLQFLLSNKQKNKFCFKCNLYKCFFYVLAHYRVTVHIF